MLVGCFFQARLERLLRLHPYDAVDELTAVEEEHGGDGVDAELGGDAGVFVSVELGDEVAACGFGGELITRFERMFNSCATGLQCQQ